MSVIIIVITIIKITTITMIKIIIIIIIMSRELPTCGRGGVSLLLAGLLQDLHPYHHLGIIMIIIIVYFKWSIYIWFGRCNANNHDDDHHHNEKDHDDHYDYDACYKLTALTTIWGSSLSS